MWLIFWCFCRMRRILFTRHAEDRAQLDPWNAIWNNPGKTMQPNYSLSIIHRVRWVSRVKFNKCYSIVWTLCAAVAAVLLLSIASEKAMNWTGKWIMHCDEATAFCQRLRHLPAVWRRAPVVCCVASQVQRLRASENERKNLIETYLSAYARWIYSINCYERAMMRWWVGSKDGAGREDAVDGGYCEKFNSPSVMKWNAVKSEG